MREAIAAHLKKVGYKVFYIEDYTEEEGGVVVILGPGEGYRVKYCDTHPDIIFIRYRDLVVEAMSIARERQESIDRIYEKIQEI